MYVCLWLIFFFESVIYSQINFFRFKRKCRVPARDDFSHFFFRFLLYVCTLLHFTCAHRHLFIDCKGVNNRFIYGCWTGGKNHVVFTGLWVSLSLSLPACDLIVNNFNCNLFQLNVVVVLVDSTSRVIFTCLIKNSFQQMTNNWFRNE